MNKQPRPLGIKAAGSLLDAVNPAPVTTPATPAAPAQPARPKSIIMSLTPKPRAKTAVPQAVSLIETDPEILLLREATKSCRLTAENYKALLNLKADFNLDIGVVANRIIKEYCAKNPSKVPEGKL